MVDPVAFLEQQSQGTPSSASETCNLPPAHDVILMNRGPVLTLWAAVVAEREGHTWPESLSYGRAIASKFANTKGVRLGVIAAAAEPASESQAKRRKPSEKVVTVFGVDVLTVEEGGHWLGTDQGRLIRPSDASNYLRRAFGTDLDRVTAVLKHMAQQFEPHHIGTQAYRLYERMRPNISPGKAGWGQKGVFDLTRVKDLADELESVKLLVWDGDDTS